MTTLTENPIEITAENFNGEGLRGKQTSHCKTLIESILFRGYAFDMSVMGTGKTYCAASIAKFLGKPIVVLCPKIVKKNWARVLDSMGVTNYVIENYEKVIRGSTPLAKPENFAQDPRRKQNKNDAPWVTLLRWKIQSDSFIIFDEAHKCKGMESSCSELLLSAWDQKYKFLLLSGSLACTPMDLFVIGRILNYHKFHDYNSWVKTTFAEKDASYFRVNVDMNSELSKSAMKDINTDINSRGISSRMTISDFPEYFKQNAIHPECFDMGEESETINQIYYDMQQEIARLEERGYTDCILAEIVKARRLAELHKVKTFVDLASECYDQGKSVAIFVNYKETLEAIVKRLNKKFGDIVSVVCGGQTENSRDDEVNKFQSDYSRFIVCNISAGGVGVNLHDLNGNHPRVSLISPTYSAVAFVQATGRIHRNGGLTDCVQYVVFSAGTIEENVCLKLKGKVDALDLLNDGDLSITGYGLDVDWEAVDLKANSNKTSQEDAEVEI